MLSVICPVYNESKYIENVLDFCINAQPLNKEIIFIDGESKDNTREIITQWMQRHSNIRLLHNPERIVPFALNRAIKESQGDIIVRLDAHTRYDNDYFEAILDTFKRSGADIVGGPTRTAYNNPTQEAVAYIICTSFGIGGSKVHDVDYEGENETVTFGSWKREIFEITGLFDESLKRNQDDEFHYRARSRGIRIYQSPSIKLYYYPRSSFHALYRQYYEYGLYKPMVLRKIKSGIRLRHLIPAMFVLYLFTLPLSFWFPLWLAPGVMYLILAFYFSLSSGKKTNVKWRIVVAYIALHLGYGAGFLMGFIKLLKRNNTK